MRVEVSSEDRIGISQDILSAIGKLSINVMAMEVASGKTYLHLDEKKATFHSLKKHLLFINGVHRCDLTELLPTESREQHVQALIRRLPALIFDINDVGEILTCNYKAHIYGNKHIERLFNVPFETFKSAKQFTVEVSFEDKMYHAEISPVWVEGVFNGAVIILNSLNKLGQQLAMFQTGHEATGLEDIIGQSETIITLKQQITKFSQLDLPILICGETGTGKELVARSIHQQSNRKDGPFLEINCASLPEQLLESELFGYVAGAFTGASDQGKPGLFELAHGGTVFLDEVAEMSVYLQAKLLRFLQDYSYRRLGGTKESVANVRIISASHQMFDSLIANKEFREDLYYRLNVLSLSLPPLRERSEDIPLLSYHFLSGAAKQINMDVASVSDEALAYLSSYSWPGNIRQLQSIIFRLVALGNGTSFTKEDVQRVLNTFPDSQKINDSHNSLFESESWQNAVETFEKQLLTKLYPKYPSTRKLAQRLKVSHNKVAMKLRQYGLSS